MAKKRTKRSLMELKEASDHLNYELSMLFFMANGLKSNFTKNTALVNAMLESFLIHARNTIDFFYNGNPRPDDILAKDFFPTVEGWKGTRPEIPRLLKETKNRAHKYLAHLTYARLGLREESKAWDFIEIEKEIKYILKIFLDNVSEEFLGSGILSLKTILS